MLLAIDIGNSHIVCGLFDGDNLKETWRIPTEKNQSEEFYRQKLSEKNLTTIDGVVIGSVVPELDEIFSHISESLFQTKPLFVSTNLNTGITNLSKTDTELGADLLADIAAAIALYPENRLVIDLGTASKFLAIDDTNTYVGGAISPGIGTSFSSLLENASKLHDLRLSQTDNVVGGLTTTEHLNSGFIFGFVSLVEGMIVRMTDELQWDNPTIILTGGFTDLIAPHLRITVVFNKQLTLEGLRFLWERNK